MRNSEFEELVNLYLDNEITEEELRLLHLELRAAPTRRRTFESYYRLHQASCVVLSKSHGRFGIRLLKKSRVWSFPFVAQAAVGAACLLIALSIAVPSLSRKDPFTQADSLAPPIQVSDVFEIKRSLAEQIDPIDLIAVRVDSRLPLSRSDPTVLIEIPQSGDLFFGRIPVILNGNSLFEESFKRRPPPDFQVEQQEQYQSLVIGTGRGGGYRPQLAGFTFQR